MTTNDTPAAERTTRPTHFHPARFDAETKAKVEVIVRRRIRDYDTAYVHGYAAGDEDYALWLGMVNVRTYRITGLSWLDLADFAWRDAYDGGDCAHATVDAALRAEYPGF